MWYPVKTPAFIRWIFPNLIWKINNPGKKVLYLTFDDGPVAEITDWVLGELEKHNAKATFFCIGRNAEQEPELYDKILKMGHSTGNHTYNHLNGWKTDTAEYSENTEKCSKVINSSLFRPPYGRLTFAQKNALLKKNYKIIMWDVICGDFDPGLSKEKCLQNILRFSKNGSIIVFHDSKKAFPKLKFVLPQVLEYFSTLGYEFRKIE